MKVGQIVTVYNDWQLLDKIEGEGKLIRKLSEGLPFILDEEAPDRKQKIFSYETWVVELEGVRKVRKIRKLSRGKKARYRREDTMSAAQDSEFITIFGKQIY